MTEDKIVRIPITQMQRKLNEYGDGYVPCEVSERWLQFSKYSSENGLIPVQVMTKGKNGDSLICELILKEHDILRALKTLRDK